MRTKHLLATLIAAFALVVLAACSDTPADDPKATFNSADVEFTQAMIPHHQQATEMAELAAERTDNADVLQLADNIIAAQQPEIDTMTAWLLEWGEDVPEEGAMHHGSGTEMPGMMTTEQMDDLTTAQGAEFDEMFLTMMIEHHEGAIDMAATEEKDGKNADTLALAKKVQADQTAEIALIQGLLAK